MAKREATEAEWLAYNDPWDLHRVRWTRRRSSRKLRLFAVACCRRGWSLLEDPRSRRAVEAHELYADKLIDKKALEAADAGAMAVASERGFGVGLSADPVDEAVWSVQRLRDGAEQCTNLMSHAARGFSDVDAGGWTYPSSLIWEGMGWIFHPARTAELKVQADLFRDVFGNPFRPSTFDPAWLAWNGGTIPDLARSMYDSRDFDRMPILGDALEEAGCADTAILGHCRGGGPHVRGCWVVDSLLGLG